MECTAVQVDTFVPQHFQRHCCLSWDAIGRFARLAVDAVPGGRVVQSSCVLVSLSHYPIPTPVVRPSMQTARKLVETTVYGELFPD